MDSWIVLLLIFIFSALGRRARKKRNEGPPPRPPRRSRPEWQSPPPRPGGRVPRPFPAPSRPEARLPQPKPPFELPPSWEPGGPREAPPDLEIPEEVPVPWSLPDELSGTPTTHEETPVSVLLERLSTAAAQAAESRGTALEPGREPPDAAAGPVERAKRHAASRLPGIRRTLSSSRRVREALVLSEILGRPKARRR